ncbi:MAG: protein-(glutamine-N5) methyltransferase, release factor-specific [Candidatus Omnitrophica bacterium CG1_02_46_14]|nr:MAG: protein-(glutamine-N5) methyltransferase, release factor-specific [Candidatus Omnitrophica bacterium CG1_02_46_14]
MKNIEEQLKNSQILCARSEAEQIVQHYSRLNRIDYFTGQKGLSQRAKRSVEAALKKRVRGKPLSYVLKEKEFFGLKFFVNPKVLIPRPETEILVEEALKVMRSLSVTQRRRITMIQPTKVLDLGTGCGCIAVSLTIHRSNCKMTALDISSNALEIARKNINFYCSGHKTRLVKSDLFGAFGKTKKGFWDLIVSNPPYVPSEDFGGLSKEVLSEPPLALNGGPQGLVVIDRILDQAPYFMKENGWLLMEIGCGQAEALADKISNDLRWKNLRFVKDLNGIERVLAAQKK